MELSVHVQEVRLVVGDVAVLETRLPEPLHGTGFGLFGWDDAQIAFSEVSVQPERARIFVIMPFREPFDTLYREVIRPVAEGLAFEIVRDDEVPRTGLIVEDIHQQIASSTAVVAEISNENPNVFYELGYAHALGKPAILMFWHDEGKNPPFDVGGYRAIFYDDSIGGKRIVEDNLRRYLEAIQREN